MTALEKRLVALQQQIEHLNAELAGLLALASAENYTAATSHKSPVGINRFRQLANEQAGHTRPSGERYVARRNG